MPRRPKVSPTIRCAACGHLMIADGYRTERIADTVTPDRIHQHYDASEPQGTFMCACGHFTVNSPFPVRLPPPVD